MDINEQLHTRIILENGIFNGLMDSFGEDFLYIAAKLYQASVSGLTINEQNQVWVKAEKNVTVEPTIVFALTSEIMRRKSALVIMDTSKDSRFELKTGGNQNINFGFYLGVPIKTFDGQVIGTLWVMDTLPRNEEEFETKPLEILAQQVTGKRYLKEPHQEKLTSLGEMVGSIAHEINNPLTIIVGNVGLLRREIVNKKFPSEKSLQYLENIDGTVRRIDKIIRGIKVLCRGGEGEPFQVLDLRESIAVAISMVIKKFRAHGIEIRHHYKEMEALVECRAFQIEQIITNLLSNALDAIKNLKEKWVEVSLKDLGTEWAISVTDSGKGVPSELRDKIMAPFFTTKERNQGTGLGLSISKSLAEEHGGRLDLDTRCLHTRFVLTLPKMQI